MIKVKATFCRHCEAPRVNYSENNRCSFCNAPLYEKEIELPELSSSEKEAADKYLVEQRTNLRSCGFTSAADSSEANEQNFRI
jgi:hypothetical protein